MKVIRADNDGALNGARLCDPRATLDGDVVGNQYEIDRYCDACSKPIFDTEETISAPDCLFHKECVSFVHSKEQR